MNGTLTRQADLFDIKCTINPHACSSVRKKARQTIADLEILNEKGLSVEQIECFLRACAVLRSTGDF